jgi:hypothetical protein
MPENDVAAVLLIQSLPQLSECLDRFTARNHRQLHQQATSMTLFPSPDKPVHRSSKPDRTPPETRTKPIKDRPSPHGLVHCTVYSLFAALKILPVPRPFGAAKPSKPFSVEQTFFSFSDFFTASYGRPVTTCKRATPATEPRP